MTSRVAADRADVARAVKVAHLVAGALDGGAARGALWLHQALCRAGVQSVLLHDEPAGRSDPSVESLVDSRLRFLAHRVARRLDEAPSYRYPGRLRRIFSTGTRGLDWHRHPAVQQADLVHLHWVNGLVTVESLARVGRPVVWTLRDMWPFTGGCHYAMDCARYTQGCGACPQLGSTRGDDLSHRVVQRKLRHWPDTLAPVAISAWLAQAAEASSVFRGRTVPVIPNGIDTQRFAPAPAKAARQRLGLPLDRRVILFAAQQVGDFYKGFDLLRRAVAALSPEGLHLLVIGRVTPEALAGWNLPFTATGFIADDEMLRQAYAAADVFVAPSVMEAFGKSLAEAQACGTPAVCFDATGPRDIVEHRVTGWRAVPFEPDDLAAGLRWVLSLSPSDAEQMRARSRERAVRLFDSAGVADRYLALYREVLGRSGGTPA